MKCPLHIFLVITLFISICPCISTSQTVMTNESIHPKNHYDGLTDFMDGRLKYIHKDVWNVEGTDFLVPDDVVFVNMNGEEIAGNTISVGDVIRVTFASDDDNRVLEVELQEKRSELQKITAETRQTRPKKHEVVILKNGVYTNESH